MPHAARYRPISPRRLATMVVAVAGIFLIFRSVGTDLSLGGVRGGDPARDGVVRAELAGAENRSSDQPTHRSASSRAGTPSVSMARKRERRPRFEVAPVRDAAQPRSQPSPQPAAPASSTSPPPKAPTPPAAAPPQAPTPDPAPSPQPGPEPPIPPAPEPPAPPELPQPPPLPETPPVADPPTAPPVLPSGLRSSL
jgi:hypothetical protein